MSDTNANASDTGVGSDHISEPPTSVDVTDVALAAKVAAPPAKPVIGVSKRAGAETSGGSGPLPLIPVLITVALASAALLWSYAGILHDVQRGWDREPDYSHGYLVAPIAAYLLWSRRDSLIDTKIQPSYWGFSLLIAAGVVRWLGIRYYVVPLQHLSIIVWIAGMFWLVGGGRFLAWALPPILFLVFLFPMPFRIETFFSQPLQKIATNASCWLLQSLGQPAFATGSQIHIGEHKIEVVQACSGLRMLVGFTALCTAYAILCARPLWEKILIVLSSIPIAIACNILRITITGLLYQVGAEWARTFSHDAAGWAMMPVALLLLLAGLWYLDRLFVESEVAESTIRVRESR